MTVAELIRILEKMPQDTPIFRVGGEYIGDYRFVTNVKYFKEPTLLVPGNSVLID